MSNKESADNLKKIAIISLSVCVLILVGRGVYRYFVPSKEQLAQEAVLKLQNALESKLQDGLIQAAEVLEQCDKSSLAKKKQPLQSNQSEDSMLDVSRHSINTGTAKRIVSAARRELSDTISKERSTLAADRINDLQEQETPKDSSAVAETVTAFGVTIGETIVSEMRQKFAIVSEKQSRESSDLMIVEFNPKSVQATELSVLEAYAVVDKQGVVVQFTLVFKGKYFHKLTPVLDAKYRLLQKDEPFVGDCLARYACGNTIICVSEPHIGFFTKIEYMTREVAGICKAYHEKQAKLHEQQMHEQF